MRVAILTTISPHHAYFYREIKKLYPDTRAWLEEHRVKPEWTYHQLDEDTVRYEQDKWFEGRLVTCNDFDQFGVYPDINVDIIVQQLEKWEPDIIFVYGTGIIRPALIDKYRGKILNFHGGDPERYRGLDSMLWAIYHRDWQHFRTVTLHHVEAILDTGGISYRGYIPNWESAKINELRSLSADTCFHIANATLKTSIGHSWYDYDWGRYYGDMPGVLKEKCVKNWEKHVE